MRVPLSTEHEELGSLEGILEANHSTTPHHGLEPRVYNRTNPPEGGCPEPALAGFVPCRHGVPARGSGFTLSEAVTGARVPCRFPPEQLAEARVASGNRVALFGRIRYSRAGTPLSISVEQIRRLRAQSELPQARDLEGINLTGGTDPVDYVRSLRASA
jgi:hypothetical protein